MTSWRNGWRSAALILIATTLLSVSGDAASIVRGKLFRISPQGQNYAAYGIGVTVSHPQRGRSTRTYSGGDGMFYLYNIPAGSYTLEVWTSSQDAQRFPIEVLEQPYTDIAPIRVP